MEPKESARRFAGAAAVAQPVAAGVAADADAGVRADLRTRMKTAGVAIGLLALAVIGRLACADIPNVQPVTALCIVAGIVCGKRYGFAVGAAAALASNVFLLQGPWTIFQMIGWGMSGYLAGALFRRPTARASFAHPLYICMFGFAASLAFGALLDTQVVLLIGGGLPASGIAAIYAAGLPFNLMHAAGTVLFLAPLCAVIGWQARRRTMREKNSGKVK